MGAIGGSSYARPLSGPPQSGSGNNPLTLRTAAGKIVTSNTQSPFVASIDGTYTAKLQQSANPFSNTFNDGISDAVAWGFPTSQGVSTTVQLRKVTLV